MLAIGNEPDAKESKKMGKAYNYDLLADRKTAELYSYVLCSEPHRSKHVVAESPNDRLSALDKVRIAVDFAYLEETEARKFSFRHYHSCK